MDNNRRLWTLLTCLVSFMLTYSMHPLYVAQSVRPRPVVSTDVVPALPMLSAEIARVTP